MTSSVGASELVADLASDSRVLRLLRNDAPQVGKSIVHLTLTGCEIFSMHGEREGKVTLV